MRNIRTLHRDDKGTAVIEFAIAMPVLIALIWGIFQLACLFWANAGIQNALGAGARMATLCNGGTSTVQCSVPTDTNISAKMNGALFGPPDGTFTVYTPATGTGYKDLRVTYQRQMTWLFITGPTVTLDRKKRVYTVS
jgi:Flp pilus assembly protein TadG